MALTKISGDVIQSNNFSIGVATVTSLNVGSAVTIHTGGYQVGSSNLHSTGLEVQNIDVSGILTAASFSGDGSGLTGIGVTRSLTIGTRTTSATINAVGTGITLSLRSGIATVNF